MTEREALAVLQGDDPVRAARAAAALWQMWHQSGRPELDATLLEGIEAMQKGQLDHFPTWRTSLNEIWDIRKRFQWCGVAIWANELPPDAKEYGDLELYLAGVNAGQTLSVPGIRH